MGVYKGYSKKQSIMLLLKQLERLKLVLHSSLYSNKIDFIGVNHKSYAGS